ncbi:MAG: ABC transporter ATP-binding protein [Oscillospiraceae bacterium]|jgi:ATP-binding cassette subfamily B multidrug efflux pump|nr:ABC transporter ATP-binding protein [Oscillospiraceae bacterium]
MKGMPMMGGKGRGMQGGVPPKLRMKPSAILIRLWKYLFRFKGLLLLAALLTVSSNLLALVGPNLSGAAIDAISLGQGKVDFSSVFYYCGLMALFYALSAGLSYLLSVLMLHISQKVTFQMRRDLFNHLADLPVSYFDRHQTGDILSRISYDIDTVNTSLSNDFLQICTSIITVTGSFIMMARISPMLLPVFLVTVPISILLTRYRSKKVRPLFSIRSAKLGELNGYTEESISGQKTIKAYHQEETMQRRFAARNEEAVSAYYQAEYYAAANGPSVNFINNLSLSLISVLGTIFFLQGRLSLGNVSAFILHSRKFSGPINELANIYSELQSALAAAERVFRTMDEEPEPADDPDAVTLAHEKGEAEMRHVRFGYLPEKEIIHDLSLKAPGGNLTAIVGHTGAGKTTLINLLMRFYDLQGGEIAIDGRNIRKVTRASLRLGYAMVLQDTWLFSGTIYENIAYGRPNATMDDVISAAKAAHIHEYISALPEGYQTVLTEDGINISQGQKQLLTIARAMLLDANMLILDEATSNVDTRTEILIQGAMRKLMEGKTCFVIAHRLSTIQNADNILVVDDGDIVEQGRHDELLKKNGVYAALYYSQFQ